MRQTSFYTKLAALVACFVATFALMADANAQGKKPNILVIMGDDIGISDEFGPLLANLIDDGQGVEMYYEIALSEAFRLSLDLQVVDPNFVTADTAVVPGMRARIEF